MKKIPIRLFSIILAIILVAGSVPYAFAEETIYAKLSADGKTYSRLSDGVFIDFTTDFDEVVSAFKTALMNRETEINIRFATKDPSFAYLLKNNGDIDIDSIDSSAYRLINKALVGAFEYDQSNPYAGDFLYHSINASNGFRPHRTVYPTDRDVVNGEQYYTFELGISELDYYTDDAQDLVFHKFVDKFNEEYMSDINDEDEYTKVKTIYDFVVRNSTYDYVVRDLTYKNDEEAMHYKENNPRFKGAHSAYGAIFGNIQFDDDKHFADFVREEGYDFDADFDRYFKTAKTIENQKIVAGADNGLAVCEGYSKLFYVLCVSNGIKCRIVDGNYKQGVLDENGKQKSDAHEWNYVYLDDNVGDDGAQWYQVDTTYASQNSLKEIDYNNYDYFLVGSGNEKMSPELHPVPYEIDAVDYDNSGNKEIRLFDYNEAGREVSYERQLYDWYGEYKPSVTDYQHPTSHFYSTLFGNSQDDVVSQVLISRDYTYKGEERRAYILVEKNYETDDYDAIRVEVDEHGRINMRDSENEENFGFPYRSLPDTEYRYHFMIPYIVKTTKDDLVVNSSDKDKTYISAGEYDIPIAGDNGSSFNIHLPITPINMSNDSKHEDNYSIKDINNEAAYSGVDIIPEASVIDGFNYELIDGVDYDICAYEDAEYKKPAEHIQKMGKYYMRIEYKGNYTGYYTFDFDVTKINLSLIKLDRDKFSFTYIPKLRRTVNVKTPTGDISSLTINNIKDYYTSGASSVTVGDISVFPDVDYTVEYTVEQGNDPTGMSFGSKGKINLTGMESSKNVRANTYMSNDYAVDTPFDITNFEIKDEKTGAISNNGLCNKPACSKAIVYTGENIKPSKSQLDNVNKLLVSDEYSIDGYSDCVNAGNATINIKGENGCTGIANMYYVIQPKLITKDMIDVTVGGDNSIYIDINYNGMTLKQDKDFTVKKETNKITISAVSGGNYYGDYLINGTNIGKLNIVFGKAPAHIHKQVKYITPAIMTKNGSIVTKCADASCGKTLSTAVIYCPKTFVLSFAAYTYDGKVKKPTVTVKDSSGKDIPAGYYSVTYPSGMKNVGKYNVVITFNGNYVGSKTVSYVINPKNTSGLKLTAQKKAFKASWKKSTDKAIGYQIRYSTKSNMSGAKTVTVSKYSTTSKTISKLSAKKKYYVQIRTYKTVKGTKYYSSWSGTKSITTKK